MDYLLQHPFSSKNIWIKQTLKAQITQRERQQDYFADFVVVLGGFMCLLLL